MADLLENLFESVDLLIDSKLKGLQYDKTELCTIEEVKGNKEYYVSNGAAKYVAYAQGDAEYREGKSVYVTIPQGDYNNQKIIIGEYAIDKTNPLNWVSPMEDFVNITGNIISNIQKAGLIANGKTYSKNLWTDNSKKSYTQYDRLCISADFSNSLIEHMVIGGNYGLILKGKRTSSELEAEITKVINRITEELSAGTISAEEAHALVEEARNKINFELFFDCSDMIGNPYDFSVPYNQEIMFDLSPTDVFFDLSLDFYQSGIEDQITTQTFYDINEELINKEQNQTENNLFVENITVNFGYSFNNYNDETAILYTLDNLNYEPDTNNIQNKPVREINLRWVHFDEDRVYNITDVGHSTLKDHYVKVHWYRYDLQSSPNDKDPLAGYFWDEINDNINKFNFKTDLDPTWTKERFKVIIEYDGRIISSQVLEFNNAAGNVGASSMITGLQIIYPEEDEYKGTFYIYGDDHWASFSTERTFDLIADYKTLDGDHEYWEDSDVICWKFPKVNTMIHKPEESFEYFTERGDIFLESGSVEVNGVTITADPNYYYVIRKIIVEMNGEIANTEMSRTQAYRIMPSYVGTAVDNTIKCTVYKPTIDSVDAEISFIFGLHTTNGTKYTLAIAWEEIAESGTYQCPPAITQGDTQEWKFSAKILDANQREIEEPDGGWPLKLEWHDKRIANPLGNNHDIENIFSLPETERKLVVNTNLRNYSNYINFAQYGILKISIEEGAFDYALTTFMPIPIRENRNIIALDGADRVYYDATGYNPRWNNKDYNLLFKQNTEINTSWGLKTTQDDYINEDVEKRRHLWTQMPRLETGKNGGKYLVAPKVYLPPAGNPYNGICVYAKEKNADRVLWVQPIYVTMDPYGSKYLNEWDGSLVIDEEKGVIMSSVIGAGKKNSDNSFSGVILGKVDGVLDASHNLVKETSSETGIVGLHKGIPSFCFRDDGTAVLGQRGAGQIQFDGKKGYIMSYNFDGWGTDANGRGKLPELDANGNETIWVGDNKWKNPTQGTYLGLSSGKAWFAGDVGVSGTIYSEEGNIGGWIINSNDLSKSMRQDGVDVYTILRAPDSGNGSTTAIAVGAKGRDATNVANAPFKVNYAGEMTATAGTIANWTIGSHRLYAQNGDGSYNSLNTIIKDGNTLVAGSNYAIAVAAPSLTDTVNAPFWVRQDGSLKSIKGTIGGWTIDTDILYASNDKKYTFLKRNGSIGIALGSATVDDTGTKEIALYHNGTAKFGYIGGSSDYKHAMTISAGGQITGYNNQWSISTEGKATFKNATIYGTITGTSSIDISYTLDGKKYWLTMNTTSKHPNVSGLNVTGTGGIACDTGANFYSTVNVTDTLTIKNGNLALTNGLLDLSGSSFGGVKLFSDGTTGMGSSSDPITLTIYRISSVTIADVETPSPSNPGITYTKKTLQIQRQSRLLYFKHGMLYSTGDWTNEKVLSCALD